LEAKVAEQGNVVRGLKAQLPKTAELEEQVKVAVDMLKKLKGDLEVELGKPN
jgi:methionyl-tRNA synthetase